MLRLLEFGLEVLLFRGLGVDPLVLAVDLSFGMCLLLVNVARVC